MGANRQRRGGGDGGAKRSERGLEGAGRAPKKYNCRVVSVPQWPLPPSDVVLSFLARWEKGRKIVALGREGLTIADASSLAPGAFMSIKVVIVVIVVVSP